MGSTRSLRNNALLVRTFEVRVVEGQDRGLVAVSGGNEVTIGTSTNNTLQLRDGAVSRHHCALRVCERGLELRDLGSTNGTFLGTSEVRLAYLASGVRLRLGTTIVQVSLLDEEIEQPLAAGGTYGELVGASPAMRRLYALLEGYAASSATLLVEGETGTGKELVAETVHQKSPRRHGPFVIVDCGALPRDLIESELFGHVRGAFTGADARRIGAFEAAAGGTVFLDEIGELPLALQPVLLRTLEARTIRPVGATDQIDVDVRVIAATNRDLRVEVNRKRFRSDLFFRLDVLRVVVPPLREREDDIERLVDYFWRMFRPDDRPPADLVTELVAQSWPGNVRELRNAVERASLGVRAPGAATPIASYGQAKERAVHAWEKRWVQQLLATYDGNLSRAARATQMGRSHLRELARRHDLRASDNDTDE